MNKDIIYQGNKQLEIELKKGTSLTVRQIDSIFQLGFWRFQSGTQLIFKPKTQLFQNLFPLTAIYKKVSTAYEFRAEQVVESEKVFLDGRIYIENESLILDATYSLSTPSEPLQIARIIQKLEPTSLSIDEFEKYGTSEINSSKKGEESSAITEIEQLVEKLDLELTPLPVTKNYRVLLNGTIENESFNSIKATLCITFSPEEELPKSVQIISPNIESGLQHGGIFWNNESLKKIPDNNWYSLTGTSETNSRLLKIKLKYQEKVTQTNCTWYSRAGTKLNNNPVPVMGENISIDLTIDNDFVTGNISGSGYYIDSLSPSTYQATVVGAIEKSNQVEELRKVLNSKNSNFTGSWSSEIKTIGEIKLQQNGNKVQGTYTPREEIPEGEIVGIVEGDFLEFHWTNGKQQGWGYLRSLNQGGTLSGVWSIGNSEHEAQAIIANWKLPIDAEAAAQDDEIFLREFRWLGHELISEQRFEQGVAVLEEVLSRYRHQRHQLNISSQEELDNLHSESFSLVGYILRCNIYLGKYNQLLDNLDHLIEVIQLLGAEESASRLFKEQTNSIKNCLIDFQQTCQFFAEGQQKTKFLLDGESSQGKVGISLGQEDSQNNILVRQVLKNSSAELADILPGDILIEVGGIKVQDISLKKVYELLIGEPDTTINVIIQREEKTLTLNLTRKLFKVYPLHRKTEFFKIINYFERYYDNLITITKKELDNLERLNFEIAKGKIDFLEAWAVLQNCLAVLGEQIYLNIEELIELKKKIFIEYPSFLEDVNLTISFMRQLGENLINHNDLSKESENIDLIELDLRVERFLSDNTDLSQIEATLFRCYLYSFQTINDFYVTINLRLNFMSKLDVVKSFEENQKSSRTMLSNLTHYIERWRSKLVDDLEKIDALEQAQPLFARVLEMSVALGDTNEALIFSEKSRARAFADLLATRFQRDVNQVLINFPITSPEITFEQIQQLAQTYSATIVEYFVVEREEAEAKVYVWVIQPNGSTILKTIELNSDSQQQNRLLSNFIKSSNKSLAKESPNLSSSAELEKSQTILAELYQLLIEPIESLFNTSSSNKVILIPHGTLFLVPFATLLNPKTQQYLIEQYSIILSPSIQTLNLTQQNFATNSEAQNILVVGNSTMPSFGSSPKLPYTETEAKAISSLFQTKSLVGKQATKREILTQLPNAKIIHFGTHGEFNDIQPLEGGIALAPEGEEGGFLTVGDIIAQFAPPQTLSLNAELVVLSACSTGLGKITGDGVIGLARGFMAAGVKAVLVSLWEVQDFPTACLMVQFYKYLQGGNTPNEALKQAQVWLKDITNEELEKWMRQEKFPLKSMEKQKLRHWLKQQQKQGNLCPFKHPYYWGAFYLIGS